MVILLHELRQGRKSLIVWTGAIALMLVICMLMFPDMKKEVEQMNELFSNMGSFTAAFGMDQVNFGEVMGFYAIECGNILGIGGGFFAALLGVSILSKEEKERTAEFLFTHPISRSRMLFEKLLAMFVQILLLNVIIVVMALLSFKLIGETVLMKEFLLLHVGYFLLQIEISFICFGISAFVKRASVGIGLGLAVIFYFLNIMSNLSEQAEFLQYITPFSYAEASNIIATASLDWQLIGLGILYAVIGVASAFWYYHKKDIAA